MKKIVQLQENTARPTYRPEQPAKDLTNVELGLEGLSTALDSLENRATHLRNRITPVLCAEAPLMADSAVEEVSASPLGSAASHIANRIALAWVRVREVDDLLESLLTRLDV